jgi:hypothetical protein
MWLISFLPDCIIHLLLLAGAAGVIAGFLLGFIPFVSTYKLPIQVISILVLVFSVYMEGGISEKQRYEKAIDEMKVKVAKAEAASAITNVEIVEKIRVETQVIHEKGEQIIKYVNKEVVKYDHLCDLPELIVTVHNAAALNKPIEETK